LLLHSIITGLLTHSVGASIVLLSGVCHLLSSVTLHGRPADGFTHTGQAMTSCRLQSNYSSTVTLHGGPVVLRLVRATPCSCFQDSYVANTDKMSLILSGLLLP